MLHHLEVNVFTWALGRLSRSQSTPKPVAPSQTTRAFGSRYFYIPARKEHRGLGGIFFDDLSTAECGFEAGAFTRDVGDAILPSWRGIVAARGGLPFTAAQRDWQLLRRGRYLVRGGVWGAVMLGGVLSASHHGAHLPGRMRGNNQDELYWAACRRFAQQH
jgi:coproporphyrinogen III oxidase